MSWENLVKRQSPDTTANREWITRVKNFKRKQAGKPFDLEAYEGMVRRGNAKFKFGINGKGTGMYMPESQSLILLEDLQRFIDAHRKDD